MKKIAERYIAHNHPLLPEHFFHNSIVPGRLLLSEGVLGWNAFSDSRLVLICDPWSNSLHHCRPGKPFAINIESEDRDRLAFSVTRGSIMIASGKLLPHGPLRADVAP